MEFLVQLGHYAFKMKRAVYLTALVFWMIGAGIWSYWEFFDTPKVIYNDHFKQVKPVRKGEPLVLDAEFCIARDTIPGSILRTIRNVETGQTYTLLDYSAATATGCYKFRRELILPNYMPPGRYEYIYQASYRINPIKIIVDTIKPVQFEILN